MKTKYFTIVSFLSLFSFIACETTERIDDFPLRPAKMVVNCAFSEDSIWEFQVSKSLSVLDNADLKLVDSATIKLFKGDLLIETLTEQSEDGWYRTANNLPESQQKYSIKVSSPDFDEVLLAEEATPQQVPISDVSIIIKDSSFYEWVDHRDRLRHDGNVKGSFNISFTDPPDIDNYYSLFVYFYDSVYADYDDPTSLKLEKRPITISSDDSSIENNKDYSVILLMRDTYFDGQLYKLKIDFDDWSARRDKVYYIQLTSHSKAGYLYKKTIDDYNQATNDPFAEPVQIYSNIENGYGIFLGYSRAVYGASF